jgi:hypothetical protein
MTVIYGIEVGLVPAPPCRVRDAIQHGAPVAATLPVVLVVSNPCGFARRWQLARECAARLEAAPDVEVFVVEAAYGDEAFRVTEAGNPRHLQVRTAAPPLWIKESMINLGVRRLVAARRPDWAAVAWVDADLDFDNPRFAADALRVLSNYDVVQLFSHAVDMDRAEEAMQVFSGFGYQRAQGRRYAAAGPGFWHPGFAWACTRAAYEQMGGLYERSILGAGDHNMALSLIGAGAASVNGAAAPGYRADVAAFQARLGAVGAAAPLSLGYVPGVVRHFYHGSKKNRRYHERWQILVKHQYDPARHVTVGPDGLLAPTAEFPAGLLEDIAAYFAERLEDE